jgi:hypothetical protein
MVNEFCQTNDIVCNTASTQTDAPLCGPNLTPDKIVQDNRKGFLNLFNRKPKIRFERGAQTDPQFILPQGLIDQYGKQQNIKPSMMISTETQTVPILIQKPQPRPPPPPRFLGNFWPFKQEKKKNTTTTGQQTTPAFVRTAKEYTDLFTSNPEDFDERIRIFLGETECNEPDSQEKILYPTKYRPEKTIQPTPFRHTEIIYSQEYLQYLQQQQMNQQMQQQQQQINQQRQQQIKQQMQQKQQQYNAQIQNMQYKTPYQNLNQQRSQPRQMQNTQYGQTVNQQQVRFKKPKIGYFM